jgi:DNA-binding MarR family transcriptional regulator
MAGQRRRTPELRVQLEPDFEAKWPGGSRLATSCFVNLWVLQGRLEHRSDQWVRREGYASSAAFNVLTVLQGANEALLPSEIAERLLVSRPTITGILDSLERQGQIRRMAHPSDGRMRHVTIMPEAGARVEASVGRLHVLERRILEALTPTDQATLLRILGSLQEAVEVIGSDIASGDPRSMSHD